MGVVTGRVASFRLGAVGAVPNIVEYIGKWTINISADTVAATYFGSYWDAGMPVGQKWSGSVEGFFDASTTGGVQQTDLWKDVWSAIKVQDARFFLGGSTTGLFYMPQWTTCTLGTTYSTDSGCYLSNWKHSVAAKELGSISFDITGYKGLGLFAATSVLVADSTG